MATENDIVRCLLLPTSSMRILLPNASVAEIISYTPPGHIDGTPDWLLGQMTWRGWRLPMLSISLMAGLGEGAPSTTARVAVVKALGRQPRMPYIGVRVQGFPRLSNIGVDDLHPLEDDAPDLPGVAARVQVKDEMALIPDLSAMESMIWSLGQRDSNSADA